MKLVDFILRARNNNDDTGVWGNIRDCVNALSDIDKKEQVFGASRHKYRQEKPLSESKIAHFERKNHFIIPLELRQYYTHFSNGGVGPHCGILPVCKLKTYQPHLPYQGFDAISENPGESAKSFCEIRRDQLQGLVVITVMDCGDEVCVVTAGKEKGQVVKISSDGFLRETGLSFLTYYHDWLHKQLALFKEIEQLLDSDFSANEIDDALFEKFECYDGLDLTMSLLGVEKPNRLFGRADCRIYHGDTQIPWYQQQIEAYRVQKRSSGLNHSKVTAPKTAAVIWA